MTLSKFLFNFWIGCAIAALFILFYASTAGAQTTSSSIQWKTMDDHVAIINGQHPGSAEDHGVRILNGQTGRFRTERGSAFTSNERRLCEAAYPDDEMGVTLCMDNARRVRSDQYDRWLGIGRHRRD